MPDIDIAPFVYDLHGRVHEPESIDVATTAGPLDVAFLEVDLHRQTVRLLYRDDPPRDWRERLRRRLILLWRKVG